MIIEITGPSGVGKTTFIKLLVEQLSLRGVATGAIHSPELNKCSLIPERFTQIDNYNLRMDIAILPWAIFGILKHLKFVLFAVIQTLKMKEQTRHKIAILRSVWRKIGLHTFLSQKKFGEYVVLVDEGVFHSCHNFLISANHVATTIEIDKFINKVPKVNYVIVLLDDWWNIKKNLYNRGTVSPRLGSISEVKQFLFNSVTLFELLSKKLSDRQLHSVKYLSIESWETIIEQCLNLCESLLNQENKRKRDKG